MHNKGKFIKTILLLIVTYIGIIHLFYKKKTETLIHNVLGW